MEYSLLFFSTIKATIYPYQCISTYLSDKNGTSLFGEHFDCFFAHNNLYQMSIQLNKFLLAMRLKLALLSILIILSSQFQIKDDKEEPKYSSHTNLGFANITGSTVSQNEVSSFVNFINSAAIYYRDDTSNRFKYISDQMNKTYGSSGYGFSIIQNPAGILDGFSLLTYFSQYASIAGGDRVYPNNSYLFGKQQYYPSTFMVELFYPGQRGYGMTDALESVIKNIIIQVQIESQSGSGCYFLDLYKIQNLLGKFDDGAWSVVCSSSYFMKASVLSYQGLATFVNPKTYYYAIWKNY